MEATMNNAISNERGVVSAEVLVNGIALILFALVCGIWAHVASLAVLLQ
jgi:hypothetical protein